MKNKSERKFPSPLSHGDCNKSLSAVQDALYVLNGKWKLPIIIALSHENKRFGELQKTVSGIAAKVLSHELKELELNGFVVRNVYNTTPVTVEYELTDYSDTLEEVITALSSWGAKHKEKIRQQMKEAQLPLSV